MGELSSGVVEPSNESKNCTVPVGVAACYLETVADSVTSAPSPTGLVDVARLMDGLDAPDIVSVPER